MEIITTCIANLQIVDYILIASKSCFRIFAITVTSEKYLAGGKFIRFCLLKGRSYVKTKEFEIKNIKTIYSRIYASTVENRDRVFYAIPYKKKDFHEIELRRGVCIRNFSIIFHMP